MLRLEKIRLKHAKLYSLTRTDAFDGFKINADDVIRFCKHQTPEGNEFEIQIKCEYQSERVYTFMIPEQVVCELDVPIDVEITSEKRKQLFIKDSSSLQSSGSIHDFKEAHTEQLVIPQKYKEFMLLKQVLQYQVDDDVKYQLKFDQLKLLATHSKQFPLQSQKIAKDSPRTQYLLGKFCKNVLDLFRNDLEAGTGVYEYLSQEMWPLNRLLFQTQTTFPFQFDCLVLYKTSLIVCEFLQHYQQGYNDLIAVILNLCVDELIVDQKIEIYIQSQDASEPSESQNTKSFLKQMHAHNFHLTPNFDHEPLQTPLKNFISTSAHISSLLIKRLQPILQMFTLNAENAESSRKTLNNSLLTQIKQVDKTLFQFISKLQQKEQMVLYIMEWILSLFTRMFYPEQTQRLLGIWGDLVQQPTIQRVFLHCAQVLSTFKANIFEKCGVMDEKEYSDVFGTEGMEFLQAVSQLRL
ncbi:Conserved_hypothetical protein [Hexamita inflata]|uniref:Uncharacterized protein n=1 Tax=Hexamita inflata TaxID=28002 RepID=A0AA86RLG3_9EUKA|nr:Conserved hypothetical protein [Hexamita inflata]